MQNLFRILCLIVLSAGTAHSQTKLFKAVTEDMDQDFKTIFQDGKLVGYLVFTQLEKASADSFNYRLSLMDENLNDIGTVNFRDEKLNLKGVSFDQDVLCLVYIKSNFVGKVYRNSKEFRRDIDNARSALHTQFLSLDGKIIATNNLAMDIKPEGQDVPTSNRKLVGNGRLKHAVQISNISGKGFVCFYGDASRNNLVVYNAAGKLMWQKQVREDAVDFSMLTSGTDISLLARTNNDIEQGDYEILSYNGIDSSAYPKFLLKDRKGNPLKVLTFDNDPVTGKPYVAGVIVDHIKTNPLSGRSLIRGTFSGIFNISIAGHTRKDIHANFSYWKDGSQNFVDKDGYYEETRGYAYFQNAFRDYQGNTWFAANNIHRHPQWGAISTSILTSWLVVPPIMILGVFGTHKYSSESVTLVKQDSSGKLSLVNSIPTPVGAHYQASVPVLIMNHRSYYNVSNPVSHSNYLVVDDFKNINIYNVSQKKVQRTIPHYAGKTEVSVYPAKEGYIMVHEINLKEKTTRLSIEAL